MSSLLRKSQNGVDDEGSLYIILSPMRGGKTSYLLHILETTGHISKSLYINHVFDIREESLPYSTHNVLFDNNLITKLNADMIKRKNLKDIDDETILKYSVICIDEAQFFTDLVECVIHIVEDLKREVYVAGLNGDYKRKNFGNIHHLLPLANDVTILNDTFCSECAKNKKKKKAIFTHRINDESGKQLEIGANNYISICRTCYLELNKN